MSKDIGAAALAVAKRELGHKENPPGSNRGSRPYMFGYAWCARFVTWALIQVGWTPIDGRPFNTDYCPSWVNAARAGELGMRVLGPTEPVRPGDLAIYDWQADGVYDHIGIVEKAITAETFWAVEGNTAVGNDSNGGQVMLRSRSRRQCLIVRLPGVKVTLAQRLRAARYGAKTVPVILRRLAAGYQGTVPNPRDRERFDSLRQQGLSADSARKVVKSLRRAK